MINRIECKYIILDVLNDCTDHEELLRFICDLVDSKLLGLLIMATSRRERDIDEQLGLRADHNINIQSAIVDEDI